MFFGKRRQSVKICLIFPRSTFLEDPMVFPPLGLWYLWPVLEKAGHDVDFIDMSQRDLQAADLPADFDVYLVSGTSPQGMEIRKIGRELAARGVPAVLGGPHVTNYPRNSRRYFPVVVRREGEEAILKAVDIAVNRRSLLMSGDDLKMLSLDNPAALEKLNAGIVEFPLIADLGKIDVPDRSRASDYRYFLEDERGIKRRATTMFTSRGCPKRCDFCDSPNLWSRRVRYAPIEKIAEEYRQIKNLGFEAIQYYDDILPINPSRMKEMCLLMKEEGFVWRCFGRTDIIFRHGGRDYLQFMRDHGLREMLIGVESGSQKILDGVHKGTTVEQNAAVFRWCD
ncbi:MAG: B12-binding domain-containing radical SAM protein, partial [Parcubacteria group bacterium]|nr:B12-binding domain-containing radical SAM protein [Parcubacteria group bacterium]